MRMVRRDRRGQAMLIAILSISGAILGATTLAGLLMLYQIRATTDTVNSAKAIFAADSGVNWSLYVYFKGTLPLPGSPAGTLSNGATMIVTCTDGSNVQVPCDNSGATPANAAISKGVSLNARRAFSLGLTNATMTLP
jgi:threonine/homoserine efflux transporter RhtA